MWALRKQQSVSEPFFAGNDVDSHILSVKLDQEIAARKNWGGGAIINGKLWAV